MPRSAQDIINQAEQLAAHFEDDFSSETPPEIAALRAAAHRRAVAEGDIARSVVDAVRAGRTWKEVGAAVGTTGEAARQRYGKLAGQPLRNVTDAVKTAMEDAAKLAVDSTKAIAAAAANSRKGRAAPRGTSSRSAITAGYRSSATTKRAVTGRTSNTGQAPAGKGLSQTPKRKAK